MGGGRCAGRTVFLVLGSVGWEAMIAAREHFVNTVDSGQRLIEPFGSGQRRSCINVQGLTFPCSVRSRAGIRSILKEWTARRKLESTVQSRQHCIQGKKNVCPITRTTSVSNSWGLVPRT